MRRPRGLDAFCVKRTWRPGLASEQTREIGLPGSRQLHSNQSASGRRRRQCASAAFGRAASGRCGRRPQHRCERADARDMERAAREHRMRSRCAAGAEGARCAQRACGISSPFASICFHLISFNFRGIRLQCGSLSPVPEISDFGRID